MSAVDAMALVEAGERDERIAAERTVLGGVLLWPDELATVAETLRPDDFGVDAHRRIFAAMLTVGEKGEPIDLITVGEALRQAGGLDAAGGLAYVGTLDADVPTVASIARCARMVRDASTRRRVVSASTTMARLATDASLTTEEVLDAAQREMLAIVEQRSAGALVQAREPLTSVFHSVQAAFEHRQKHGSAPIGLSTGLADLDAVTSGLHPGDLVIVAARPSMGKTALVMNVAAHVAIRGKRPVAVFSLEMGKESLLLRVLASEAMIDHGRLKNGDLDDRDWPKLARASEAIARAPLYIDDSGSATVFDVRARCRRLKAKAGDLALVAVDYLQLMNGGASRGDSREQEISGISRGLKALARELGCPVIALSQLSRAVEKRPDKRPMMSDLRESGAIEQDADTIAFIYRDEYYNKESPDSGVAEAIVAKQRNGPTGTTRLKFNPALVRFDNLEDRYDR